MKTIHITTAPSDSAKDLLVGFFQSPLKDIPEIWKKLLVADFAMTDYELENYTIGGFCATMSDSEIGRMVTALFLL